MDSINIGGGLGQFLRRDRYRITVSVRSPVPSRHTRLVPTRHKVDVRRIMRLLGGCSFSRRHHLDFRCVMFGKIGSDVRRTGTVVGLIGKLSYHFGLVHFRRVPSVPLRNISSRGVRRFHSCLATRNIFAAVHTDHNRSVCTTYNLLDASGGVKRVQRRRSRGRGRRV